MRSKCGGGREEDSQGPGQQHPSLIERAGGRVIAHCWPTALWNCIGSYCSPHNPVFTIEAWIQKNHDKDSEDEPTSCLPEILGGACKYFNVYTGPVYLHNYLSMSPKCFTLECFQALRNYFFLMCLKSAASAPLFSWAIKAGFPTAPKYAKCKWQVLPRLYIDCDQSILKRKHFEFTSECYTVNYQIDAAAWSAFIIIQKWWEKWLSCSEILKRNKLTRSLKDCFGAVGQNLVEEVWRHEQVDHI